MKKSSERKQRRISDTVTDRSKFRQSDGGKPNRTDTTCLEKNMQLDDPQSMSAKQHFFASSHAQPCAGGACKEKQSWRTLGAHLHTTTKYLDRQRFGACAVTWERGVADKNVPILRVIVSCSFLVFPDI